MHLVMVTRVICLSIFCNEGAGCVLLLFQLYVLRCNVSYRARAAIHFANLAQPFVPLSPSPARLHRHHSACDAPPAYSS